jgi:hypothetical protein
LEPTILNMMQTARQGGSGAPSGIVHALSECARNFLAYEVNAIRIDPTQPQAQVDAEMRHLAARLLENALPLQSSATRSSGFGVLGLRELSRSH